MRTSDIQWLSGLLEGEGYFGNSKQNMIIGVDMTDLDVMERIGSLMGRKVLGPYMNGPLATKPKYRVQIAGSKAAGWMMTLYPQLGSRRQARIRELLTDWRSRPSAAKGKRACVGGHLLSGDNLYLSGGKRRCRACAVSYSRLARERRKREAIVESVG